MSAYTANRTGKQRVGEVCHGKTLWYQDKEESDLPAQLLCKKWLWPKPARGGPDPGVTDVTAPVQAAFSKLPPAFLHPEILSLSSVAVVSP